MTLVVRMLTDEYFLACAVLPTGSLGKARYLMRVTAPTLRADLTDLKRTRLSMATKKNGKTKAARAPD